MDKKQRKNVYVTVDGIEVEYGPVSVAEMMLSQQGVEREYRERGEFVDPPKYTVEVMGGDKIEIPHTDDSEKSDEEQMLWTLYQDAIRRMRREQNDIRTLMMLEGVKVDLPADDSWMERQKKYKISIPDDLEDRRLHYLSTIVFKSPVDASNITMDIMALSARGIASQEEIEAAEATFRDNVVKPGSRSDKESVEEEEQVDVQRKVPRGSSGKRVRTKSRPVSKSTDDGTSGDDSTG